MRAVQTRVGQPLRGNARARSSGASLTPALRRTAVQCGIVATAVSFIGHGKHGVAATIPDAARNHASHREAMERRKARRCVAIERSGAKRGEPCHSRTPPTLYRRDLRAPIGRYSDEGHLGADREAGTGTAAPREERCDGGPAAHRSVVRPSGQESPGALGEAPGQVGQRDAEGSASHGNPYTGRDGSRRRLSILHTRDVSRRSRRLAVWHATPRFSGTPMCRQGRPHLHMVPARRVAAIGSPPAGAV